MMSLRWRAERSRRREGWSPHPHAEPKMKVSAHLHQKTKSKIAATLCRLVITFQRACQHPSPIATTDSFAPPTLFIPDQVFHTAFSENDKCWSPGKILGLICLSSFFFSPLCCGHSMRSFQTVGNCSVLIPTMFEAGLDSQLAHNCSLQRDSPPSSAAVQPFSLTP